jgi:hypothetical protein
MVVIFRHALQGADACGQDPSAVTVIMQLMRKGNLVELPPLLRRFPSGISNPPRRHIPSPHGNQAPWGFRVEPSLLIR